MVRAHALGRHRKDPKLVEEELSFRVVDIGGTRLYAAVFPAPKARGIMGVWQNPGIGPSIRLAEDLLAQIDTITDVYCDPRGANPPARIAAFPESEAHESLRQRISNLLHRAAIDPVQIRVTPKDIYLYQTGMAALYAAHNALLAYRPGTVVVLGAIFHSTIHWLSEQSPQGYKHFGPVDTAGLDVFESYLREERSACRNVSYVLVEFPSNPLLASANLRRLKALSEEHGFVLEVDDTIGSFANIDVLPATDLLVTSLTKSFSGYADVMAGSTALNPLSPHFTALKTLWEHTFVNEFYARDAEVLLKNSDNYLHRTAILNANASLIAGHLSSLVRSPLNPTSPLLRVRYPPLLPDYEIYTSFLRRTTPELPFPGAGCLLNIDFEDLDAAKAFYNNLAFYPGPHLGAHKSLSLCYAALVFGKYPEEAAVHRSYGILEESVRISAGLEDGRDLVDTVDKAMEAVREVNALKEKREGKVGGVGAAEAAIRSGLAA